MANVLGNLQKQVQVGRKDGTLCPCCGLYVKEYHRRINSAMVWSLSLIYEWYKKNDPTLKSWMLPEEYMKEISGLPMTVVRGDWTKLVHWKLIERQKSIRNDSSYHVGHYRITQKGIDFLKGKISVPKTIVLFNAKLLRMSSETCTVNNCLNKHFNYNKLMGII
jgi:hypothetical protein